jgi:hypothetical protein
MGCNFFALVEGALLLLPLAVHYFLFYAMQIYPQMLKRLAVT